MTVRKSRNLPACGSPTSCALRIPSPHLDPSSPGNLWTVLRTSDGNPKPAAAALEGCTLPPLRIRCPTATCNNRNESAPGDRTTGASRICGRSPRTLAPFVPNAPLSPTRRGLADGLYRRLEPDHVRVRSVFVSNTRASDGCVHDGVDIGHQVDRRLLSRPANRLEEPYVFSLPDTHQHSCLGLRSGPARPPGAGAQPYPSGTGPDGLQESGTLLVPDEPTYQVPTAWFQLRE